MATAGAIKVVAEMLGPAAADNGWNNTRIGADLDANMTANRIAAAWWTARAASTAHLVSISESGSSRSLGDVYRAALALAAMYQARADAELNINVPADRGWSTVPINRV